MRTLRTLAAAVLATSGLVAVGVTTDAATAASSKDLSAQHGGKVIKNETFYLNGRTKTHFERQVKLQYKSGSTWKTKKTTTANSDGYFGFTGLSTTKTRSYRYYAAATEGAAKIVGNPTKVTVVRQKAEGYTNPYPATYTYFNSSSHYNGNVYAVLDFYPAREGRVVSFETPNGVDVSGVQDARGHVVIPFNVNKFAGSYYFVATTEAINGAGSKSTAPIRVKVETRFIILDPLKTKS